MSARRVAVVTGGSTGVGRELDTHGWDVGVLAAAQGRQR
jgi:NAD(P)-dependent dehydrogenase (short-subunit alcohol dehydrogenase family)